MPLAINDLDQAFSHRMDRVDGCGIASEAMFRMPAAIPDAFCNKPGQGKYPVFDGEMTAAMIRWRRRTPLWKGFGSYGVPPSNPLWLSLLWMISSAGYVGIVRALLIFLLAYTAWIIMAVWYAAPSTADGRYGVSAKASTTMATVIRMDCVETAFVLSRVISVADSYDAMTEPHHVATPRHRVANGLVHLLDRIGHRTVRPIAMSAPITT